MFNEDDAKIWEAQLDNPDYLVIRNDYGFLIGQKIIDEIEIFMIYIKPVFRGRGFGKILLSELIENSAQASIFLEVSSENTIAHNFYKNMGFSEYKRRTKYYKDNSDAILMKYPISN